MNDNDLAVLSTDHVLAWWTGRVVLGAGYWCSPLRTEFLTCPPPPSSSTGRTRSGYCSSPHSVEHSGSSREIEKLSFQ